MNGNSHIVDQDMTHLLDDELLETFLKEASQKRCIQRLIDRQSKKLCNDGDNYVSVTWQEIVKVANKQGSVWQERLIVKDVPKGDRVQEFIKNDGIFKKEIHVYTEILPKMENLIRKSDKCGDRLWPRCLGMKPYTMILLEDLTAKGFQKVDRLLGLDLEHSLFAFKALAKFHTLSLALKDELKLNSKEYERFVNKEYSKRKQFFEGKVKPLAETMIKEWEPKWHRLAKHLLDSPKTIIERFLDICERKDTEFNVLNHGDPWTSNILYKYSEFSGNVIGIRFVDFQMRHYSSFAIDLQYLLQTSVQLDVIKNHTDDLLAAYHETLLKTARKLGSTNIVIPSLTNIKAEMNAKKLVGIVMVIYLLDMMLVDPSEAVDLETILQNNYSNGKPLPTNYQDRMRVILEPYINCDLSSL